GRTGQLDPVSRVAQGDLPRLVGPDLVPHDLRRCVALTEDAVVRGLAAVEAVVCDRVAADGVAGREVQVYPVAEVAQGFRAGRVGAEEIVLDDGAGVVVRADAGVERGTGDAVAGGDVPDDRRAHDRVEGVGPFEVDAAGTVAQPRITAGVGPD